MLSESTEVVTLTGKKATTPAKEEKATQYCHKKPTFPTPFVLHTLLTKSIANTSSTMSEGGCNCSSAKRRRNESLFSRLVTTVTFPGRLSLILLLLLLLRLTPKTAADIGIISFWTPELLALLQVIKQEGSPLSTYIFGGRRFYVTSFQGHNVVVVNGGESISNSAATAATLLQKFPNIKRIVGSGVAGGVVSS